MAHCALRNRNGYTLIEVIISMAILAVVATALMKSSLLVIKQNQQNEIRDEAVRIATQRMNETRFGQGGFDGPDLLPGLVSLPSVTRIIRGGIATYDLTKNVAAITGEAKQVTITVNWMFRGKQYSHSTMSVVRRFAEWSTS